MDSVKTFLKHSQTRKPSQVGEELAATDVGEEHVEEALVFAAPGQVDQERMIDLLMMRKRMMVKVMGIINQSQFISFTVFYNGFSPENCGWPSLVRISH